MAKELSYSSICQELTMRLDLSEMPNRDKVNLFRQLCHDFGIMTLEDTDAVDLVLRQADKHWP